MILMFAKFAMELILLIQIILYFVLGVQLLSIRGVTDLKSCLTAIGFADFAKCSKRREGI